MSKPSTKGMRRGQLLNTPWKNMFKIYSLVVRVINCCVRTNWKMNKKYVLNKLVELETSELMFNQQIRM